MVDYGTLGYILPSRRVFDSTEPQCVCGICVYGEEFCDLQGYIKTLESSSVVITPPPPNGSKTLF
jgi:hypothetical protein